MIGNKSYQYLGLLSFVLIHQSNSSDFVDSLQDAFDIIQSKAEILPDFLRLFGSRRNITKLLVQHYFIEFNAGNR